MLSPVLLLIAYVRALAAMVAVAVFVGCGTHFIAVPVPRPAAINMKDFDTIALRRIVGETSSIFSAELTKAIYDSGQFEVLSSEALALKRMESNEATGKAALVSGSISSVYDERHSISTLKNKDKETGEIGGYGIPVTSGTRVLLNANFALRRIEGEQTKSVGITLNGLF